METTQNMDINNNMQSDNIDSMDTDDSMEENASLEDTIRTLLLDPERSRIRYWALLSDHTDLHERAATALGDTKRFGVVAQDTRTLPSGKTLSLVRLREQVHATSVRGVLGDPSISIWKVADNKALAEAMRQLPTAVPGMDLDGDGLAATLFKFGEGGGDWSGKTIRCTNTVPRKADVFDVLVAIGYGNPKDKFKEVMDADQSLINSVGYSDSVDHQNPRPVADAKGLVRIILALTGPKVAAFKAAAAELIVRYLGGDETLVDEVRANRRLQESLPEGSGARLFGEYVENGGAGGSEEHGAAYWQTLLQNMQRTIEDRNITIEERNKTIRDRDTLIEQQQLIIEYSKSHVARLTSALNSTAQAFTPRILPEDPDSSALGGTGNPFLRDRLYNLPRSVTAAMFGGSTKGSVGLVRRYVLEVLNVDIYTDKPDTAVVGVIGADMAIQRAIKLRSALGWGRAVMSTEITARQAYTIILATAVWLEREVPHSPEVAEFKYTAQVFRNAYEGLVPASVQPRLGC